MHTRLPSFTFVRDPVYAQTEWSFTPPATTPHYQGSDIVLPMFLLDADNEPITLGDYRLTFVVKKSEMAENVIFQQDITTHPANKPAGVYEVTIPATISSRLPAGVYYFVVQAAHKTTGRIMPPFRGCFSLELSAASPNPKLGIQDGEPTAIGPGGTADELRVPAEITGPNTPDIGQLF